MTTPSPRFLRFGDAALLVEFGTSVSVEISALVTALDARLAGADIPGLTETAPSFRSLMVQFDPLVTDADEVERAIRAFLPDLDVGEATGALWRLPACYEGDLAPDLADVAARCGMGVEDVVAQHSSAEHRVFMIGFLPGCPYMGGLPDGLSLPRRTDPRIAVPAGSVAIAVGQTVIYPVESPGGWHLIGRCPVPLFDAGRPRPALLEPGDRVRFEPVARAEHDRIAAAIADGSWDPEQEARA